MARPRVEIDWKEFDKLCEFQCTQSEIASWFRCSVDTIDRAVKRKHNMGFAEYFAQKAATGKISLRRKQWQLALAGDKTMLIWLGKQHLRQSEKVDHVAEVTATSTVSRISEDQYREWKKKFDSDY